VPFISINVEIIWGKNFGAMCLHPLTQLSAIRKRLENDAALESIPLDTYWFTFDGKEHLKESRNLWDLDVIAGSTLYMRSFFSSARSSSPANFQIRQAQALFQ
jgi:hypothetical protein